MRIKEISKAGSYTDYNTDGVDPQYGLKKFFELIQRDCSEILSIYKQSLGKFLYRGIASNPTAYYIYGKSRENRLPTDMDTNVHFAVNALIQKLGFEANRINSIFVTSSDVRASGYGPPFIIFPFDGFKYTWSPKAHDLFSFINHNHQLKEKLKNDPFGFLESAPVIQLNKKYFEFQNTEIEKAIHSDHEVLIHGSYYGIKQTYVQQKVGGIEHLEYLIQKS